MKKIGIVSFRYEARDFNKYLHKTTDDYKKRTWSEIVKYAKEFNKSRMKEIGSIADKVSEDDISYVLFPGNTLIIDDKIWDDDGYIHDLKRLKKLFNNISVIIELRYFDEKIKQYYPPIDTGTICLEHGKEIGERIQQIFAESSGYPKKYLYSMYKRFWAENIWGHRIKKLDGIRFLIWVCGEINFLRCPQKTGEDPIPRFHFNNMVPDPLNDLQYDVLFNPVHTPMGELHILKRKLAYLSRKGRLAIQTTNIPPFQKSTKSAFFCFKNGKEIPSSKTTMIEHTRWIMNIIEI